MKRTLLPPSPRSNGLKPIRISAESASRVESIGITKARISQDDRKRSLINLKASIFKELDAEANALETKLSTQDRIYAPLHKTLIADRHAFTAAKGLHNETLEKQARISASGLGALQTLDYKVNLGSKLLVPPYDEEWHTPGLNFAKKATGNFLSFSAIDSGAAAVGVRLTASKSVLLRFTTLTFVKYAWDCWAYSAAAATAGGIGIIGYRDNEKIPFDTERATLWNHTLGSGVKSDSGSTSFGGIKRSFFVPMEPGHSYLIWLWCWTMGRSISQGDRLSLGLARIECDAPLILLDAQPPPYYPPLH
jgi:hypothetical protein